LYDFPLTPEQALQIYPNDVQLIIDQFHNYHKAFNFVTYKHVNWVLHTTVWTTMFQLGTPREQEPLNKRITGMLIGSIHSLQFEEMINELPEEIMAFYTMKKLAGEIV
jgi:hypothetical protein